MFGVAGPGVADRGGGGPEEQSRSGPSGPLTEHVVTQPQRTPTTSAGTRLELPWHQQQDAAVGLSASVSVPQQVASPFPGAAKVSEPSRTV